MDVIQLAVKIVHRDLRIPTNKHITGCVRVRLPIKINLGLKK